MPQVYVGIGSNLGDRKGYFEFAARELLADGRIHDLKQSPVYETEPVGGEGQARYWNAVWSFVTELPSAELLKKMHEIEARAGRQRMTKNEARVLDLDILFYGNEVSEGRTLVIPHPRLHERAFVLAPFCDLAPEFVHPTLKKTIKVLLNELEVKEQGISGVRRIGLTFPEKT
ncbi:MAG: 2-amino-4-hydroxy-6-hydroxymethyldihydropteridine diphosphokinase [Candidatus Omnitrophica bacterium]|nr:2-amino-4-hydroxy-6-hydroxymethyldihydropteridine diphosphokinase [Candidatus Omnitrophota bacterium]